MLEIKNLTHRYGDGTVSLQNINFIVEKGDCLCLAGANGSGKSTLLRLIATSLKPSGGDILLHERSIYENLADSRHKIGMIFQDPDDQLFMPAVWENVAYGVLNKGVKMADAKDMAIEALRAVDAEHLAERVSYRLSGGEKHRAAIASVLIMEPEILILDEPTSALDPKARKNIIDLLQKLCCTKIIATHDLDMAEDVCDKAVFLHKGAVAAVSEIPGRLRDESFLQNIGLELPLKCRR